MKTMMETIDIKRIEFASDFHITKTYIRVRDGKISSKQIKAARKRLCNSHGCCCGYISYVLDDNETAHFVEIDEFEAQMQPDNTDVCWFLTGDEKPEWQIKN